MRLRRAAVAAGLFLAVPAFLVLPAGQPLLAQQPPVVTFESMVADLGNDDPDVRLRAVLALKGAAYPESAVPLTRSLADGDDRVQVEAIAAELNIWLGQKVEPRKRVGMVVEVRNRIDARQIFLQGPAALDPKPVPLPVLHALRAAGHDDNPRVSLEAIYAFGALGDNVYGADRAELLTASSAELAAALGVPQGDLREAAMLVVERLYGWRMGDAGVDPALGDAVVTALNDKSYVVRTAAMRTLGAMRYDRAVQSLTDMYQHYGRGPNAAVALAALARIAHPSSLSLFVEALGSRDALLKLPAIEGLARSGATSQAQAIASAVLVERNRDVQLAGTFAGVLLNNGSMNELIEGLAQKRLHDRALGYLIDVAPGRSRSFGPHLPDPQAGVRADLALVVGLSGDRDAVSLLQPLMQDPDPIVARSAQRAAYRLAGSSSQQ